MHHFKAGNCAISKISIELKKEKYLQIFFSISSAIISLIEKINKTTNLNFLLKESRQIKGGNTEKVCESSPDPCLANSTWTLPFEANNM